MVRVISRRLIQLFITLIALMTLVFFWLRSLPGGPVDALLGERATPQTRELLTRALGYDQPIWVQAIVNLPLKTSPGQKFHYCTGQSHLVSAIISEKTGMTTPWTVRK